MTTKKENNTFLLKYHLIEIFSSMYFINSFIIIIVDESVRDPFKISILLIIFSIVKIIFEIPSGAFADRFGRKNTLILASFCGISALIFFLLRRNYTDFIISYFLLGLCHTLRSGAFEAFIYDNMKKLNIEKDYAKYESRQHIISEITYSLSALFASYLILFGYNIVIIATIISSFILSLLVVLSIKDSHWHDKNISKLHNDYWKILKKGFIYSFKHKIILKFIMFLVLVNSFRYILDNYYALILLHITNNLSMVPILTAIGCGLSGFSSFIITKYVQNKKVTFIIGIGIFSIFLILVGLSIYSFPISYILIILFWSSLNIFTIVMGAKKQIFIPSKIRATVNSVEGFLFGIISVAYLLSFGKIVEIYSYKTGFIVFSGITLLVTIIFFFILGFDKRLRRREARLF